MKYYLITKVQIFMLFCLFTSNKAEAVFLQTRDSSLFVRQLKAPLAYTSSSQTLKPGLYLEDMKARRYIT